MNKHELPKARAPCPVTKVDVFPLALSREDSDKLRLYG